MNREYKTVAVYCSARDSVLSTEVERLTADAAALLVEEFGLDLVYGGGARGVMNAVAREFRNRGARVHGVITEHLLDIEGLSIHVTDSYVVETMGERKEVMKDLADIVLALPGGLGTLDELIDICVHNQLYSKRRIPILVYKTPYFDRIFSVMKKEMTKAGVINPEDLDYVLFWNNIEELRDLLLILRIKILSN